MIKANMKGNARAFYRPRLFKSLSNTQIVQHIIKSLSVGPEIYFFSKAPNHGGCFRFMEHTELSSYRS